MLQLIQILVFACTQLGVLAQQSSSHLGPDLVNAAWGLVAGAARRP